jgi:hypothetical protein
MSALEDALLNIFQNIERKRKAFEELFTAASFKNQKKRSLSLPAKRLVPFIRMQKVMWL